MTREGDAASRSLSAALDDRDTSVVLAAERAFLAVLDGSCRTPIGGLARLENGTVYFRGIIVKPDGSEAHEVERQGPMAEVEKIGADAGGELARRGGAEPVAVAEAGGKAKGRWFGWHEVDRFRC